MPFIRQAKKSQTDSGRVSKTPRVRTLLGANFTFPDLWGGRRNYTESHGGDDRGSDRENGGGVILGDDWNAKEDDDVSCPCPDSSVTLADRKRCFIFMERESIEEEEQQKARIPPYMVRTVLSRAEGECDRLASSLLQPVRVEK